MHTPNETQTQTDWMGALDYEARTLVEELNIHPAARRLIDGSIDVVSYAHYLVLTYHYVRWTTPLLAEAGHRMKRMGRHQGRRASWKKAVVTLAPGHTIELVEGA